MPILLLEHRKCGKRVFHPRKWLQLQKLFATNHHNPALEPDSVTYDCIQTHQIVCDRDHLNSKGYEPILWNPLLFRHFVFHFPHVHLRWKIFASCQDIIHTHSRRAWIRWTWHYRVPYLRGLYNFDNTCPNEFAHSYFVWCLWAGHVWEEILWWKSETLEERDVWEA